MIISPPPSRLTHKLIAVCAVALVVAGSWAKPAVKQSPLIHLEQIDHYNSIVTTGVDVHPADNPTIEFDRLFYPEIIPAARVRNSAGTLRLKWSNQTVTSFVGYAKVHEARYRYLKKVPNGQHYYVDIPVSSNSTPIPVTIAPSGESGLIEIPLGNLPNFVVDGELQLKIELRGNIGSQLPGEPDSLAWGNKDIWSEFGTVYLTAQQPADIQEKPWIEVLEQTCWFAQEMAAEVDVRREITKGIFFETLVYDPGPVSFISVNGDGSLEVDLKNYFDPDTKTMDCRGGAGLTTVMCESLGFPTTVRYLLGQYNPAEPQYEPHIKTNPLCRAGNDPSMQSNYVSEYFNYHCIAESNNTTFDSVAAQWFDTAGGPWRNPVWGWNTASYAQSGTYGLIVWPFPYPFSSLTLVSDVVGVS